MFGLFKKKPKAINDKILKDNLIVSLREQLESMNESDRITIGGQEMFEFLMQPHKGLKISWRLAWKMVKNSTWAIRYYKRYS